MTVLSTNIPHRSATPDLYVINVPRLDKPNCCLLDRPCSNSYGVHDDDGPQRRCSESKTITAVPMSATRRIVSGDPSAIAFTITTPTYGNGDWAPNSPHCIRTLISLADLVGHSHRGTTAKSSHIPSTHPP
ncbi:hypothetical protein SprV_0301099900 [Sparganum proliferum]